MNKNSNIYQIVYSAVMVVIVGALLAMVYMWLKPMQDENIANDKRMQILTALNVAGLEDANVKEVYESHVIQDMLVDEQGNVVDSTANVAFDVDMASNYKAKTKGQDSKLPVFKCKADDGSIKYVVPLYGAGLWGPIWGFVAFDADGSTIYGANFSHQGETPGLGARIADRPFQESFVGKQVFKDGAFKNVEVVKKGMKPGNDGDYVDAITGATITSRGVSDMLGKDIAPYEAFLKKLQEN